MCESRFKQVSVGDLRTTKCTVGCTDAVGSTCCTCVRSHVGMYVTVALRPGSFDRLFLLVPNLMKEPGGLMVQVASCKLACRVVGKLYLTRHVPVVPWLYHGCVAQASESDVLRNWCYVG